MNIQKILVWDAPTRVFHWLLALCFAGAYTTSEGGERLMAVHLTLGYTMVGLVVFRVVWGVLGTRYARFSNFVTGPGAAMNYAAGLLSGRAPHPVGHNPLGGWSIVAMLLATLAVVGSGWVYLSAGVHALKELHEGVAALMLALVGLHIAAVVLASLTGDGNLVTAMLNGHKSGRVQDGIRWSWWPVGALLLAAVLGFWYVQAVSPTPLLPTTGAAVTGDGDTRRGWGEHGRSDDD